jgi:CRP-like cAMP-binding protein
VQNNADSLASGNRLLAALSDQDRAQLHSDMEEVRLEDGAIIVDADQDLTHAYFPHDSVVSLVSMMADGRVAETATIGREGAVGFDLLSNGATAFNRHSVQVAGRASRIEIGRMRRATQQLAGVRTALSRYTQAFVAQVLQSVACNGLHDVEERCSRWLLMTHDRVGKDSFPLTQEFLAEMLGVHRPTVSVAARALQQAGLIQYRRGVVTILDRAELESAGCECYGIVRRRFERLLPLTFT